jgi:hypothetical protein
MLSLALLTLTLAQSPGVPATAELHATVVKLDTALFGTALFDAYNRCDLPQFQALLDPAIEFYHDHGGVTLSAAAPSSRAPSRSTPCTASAFSKSPCIASAKCKKTSRARGAGKRSSSIYGNAMATVGASCDPSALTTSRFPPAQLPAKLVS